jgi:hypothetical protein
MFRRISLVSLVLASAAFPAACSSDKNDDQGTATGGDSNQIDTGSGGNDGMTSDEVDEPERAGCPDFQGLPECNSASLAASPVEVNILLVLDSSGSMSTSLPDDSKATLWQATKTALTDTINTSLSGISYGIDLFPNAGPTQLAAQCEMPETQDLVVPIGTGDEHRQSIIDAINSKGPGGGTPTAAALNRAFHYFSEGTGKDRSGRKFVLLATDGGPNCSDELSCEKDTCTSNIDADPEDPTNPCGGEDAPNCCAGKNGLGCLDDAGTVAAVEALSGVGVDTFVVGLPGSELYEEQLNKFAIAGGRPNTESGATESYYKVDAKGAAAGLADVLKKITRKLITNCTVELKEEPANEELLNLAVDCVVIHRAEGPQGDGGSSSSSDTWYYDRITNSAIIQGPKCDDIENTGVERIDVIEGCPPLR